MTRSVPAASPPLTTVRPSRVDDPAGNLGPISDAPELGVIVSMHLLAKIALDPLQGNSVDAFLLPSSSGSDHVLVSLGLHVLKNPVGAFLVMRDGPSHQEIRRAVEANLAGRHFRAARAYRRAREREPRRLQRLESAAVALQRAAERRLLAAHPVAAEAEGWEALSAIRSEARQFYRSAFDTGYDRYRKRLLALSNAAQDPGWHDALVAAEGRLGLRQIGRMGLNR